MRNKPQCTTCTRANIINTIKHLAVFTPLCRTICQLSVDINIADIFYFHMFLMLEQAVNGVLWLILVKNSNLCQLKLADC